VKPVVSILIPAFNAAPWIADTIKSALAQTWAETEIIMVDDGSTDRTLAIARQFASGQVTVVTQENQGASAARNRAFSLSHGDYIQWLDADDLLAPDKISKQMEVAGQQPDKRTLLSSEWGHFMYRTGSARFIPTTLWTDLAPVEWLVRKLSLNLHMQPASWLVSRELTEAAGPWDTRLSLDDDGEYFCRVIRAASGIRFIAGARSYYRLSGCNSLSRVDQSDKKLESLWLSLQLHIRHLRTLEDSARTRAAGLTYLQNWLPGFFPRRPDLAKEAQALATELGGRLGPPQLRRKYAWLQTLLGPAVTRHLQVCLPDLKLGVARWWDKTLFQMENRQAVADKSNPTHGTSSEH